MIRLRLSDKTRKLLALPNTHGTFSKKNSAYYNSPEFYAKHPDLMPRNIYLATGRVTTKEEIDKYFDETFKLSFREKCGRFLDKAKGMFKINNSLSDKSEIK